MSNPAPLGSKQLLLVTGTPALEPVLRHSLGYRVQRVSNWSELVVAAGSAPAGAIAVVDPCAEGDGGLAPGLQQLLLRRPLLSVVAAVHRDDHAAALVPALLEWGVSEVLDLELEHSADAFARRIRAAYARPVKRLLEGLLGNDVSENARELVRAACEAAVRAPRAATVASYFDTHPRTVTRWCAREGLPVPRSLLAWVRVLLGTALLREEDRTIVSAARAAGYTNDFAFRRSVREVAKLEILADARAEVFRRAGERFENVLLGLRRASRDVPGMTNGDE